MSISYEGGVQAGDDFLLGSVVSQSVKIELLTDADLYETQTVTFKLGLKTDSTTTEWVPFSTFYIDSIEETQDGTVSLTCYDAIIKSEVEFTGTGYTTLAQVATKITAQTGIAFADTIPSTAVSTLSTGATIRTVLGYIASYMGGFMVVNRSNQYKVVKPLSASVASVTTDNYFKASVEKSAFQIGKLTCIISTDSSHNDTKLSSGTLTTTTKEVQFENPWMTQARLNSIKTSYAIFTYTGMEVELQGNPALDSCDIVTLTHKNGMTYALPVLHQKITFNGGITQTITCKGITTLKNSFSSEGDSAKALEKVQAQQGIFNSLVTESLSANDGTFINVSSKFAEIETAYVKTAEIDTALIGSATITNLDTGVANINTLISGSTVSGSTQTIVLNAVNSTFDSAYFKALVSENIVASDILAGHINTNDITISDGPDTTGNFVISGKTLQIKDGTRVRVQLGEDASADYNLYIWDASGNLMFDATGLKESGVQTAIIKDSMVKSDANISGSKLNISSVVSSINAGTTKISASTVYLDTQAQTLQVAFGDLVTVIGDTSSFTNNQTTIAATVNGLSSTVSSQAQTISTLSTNYSTLSQDYSGFKVTVGNTYATQSALGDLSSTVSLLQQDITATAIITKINSALSDSSQISTTSFTMDKSGFTIFNGALTIKNNESDIVFGSDTSGNVVLNSATFTGGTITQNCSNGNLGTVIENGEIDFYSYNDAGNLVGRMFADTAAAAGSQQSLCICHDSGDVLYIGLASAWSGSKFTVDPAAITIAGQSSTTSAWNQLTFNSIRNLGMYCSGNINLTSTDKVYLASNGGMISRNKLVLQGASFITQTVAGANGFNHVYDAYGNAHFIGIGDSGGCLHLGYSQAISNTTWNWNIKCGDGETVIQNLLTSGTKNRIVQTDYGAAYLNAYETTECLFGEVGTGVISDDGTVRVYFSEVYKDTISANLAYHVFLTSYSSSAVYCSERTPDYFIVCGTPGTEFSFEAKVKQKGYENPGIRVDCKRWDIDDPTESYIDADEYDAAAEADDYLQTLTDEQDNLIYE